MSKVQLTDDSGRWFDPERSQKFEEDTWFDGHNHVSVATGDQWVHEALYKTPKGKWILNHWSQWQGSKESYTEISEDEAFQWLLTNGHHDEVPDDVVQENEV